MSSTDISKGCGFERDFEREARLSKAQEWYERMKEVKGNRIVPEARQLDENSIPMVGSTRTFGRVRRPAICSDAYEIPSSVRRNMAS